MVWRTPSAEHDDQARYEWKDCDEQDLPADAPPLAADDRSSGKRGCEQQLESSRPALFSSDQASAAWTASARMPMPAS